MKKIVLVDGNNLMFRSYYATAYTGKIMTNSKGFPTNALYGFVNMINKIISEEKPEYMAVAFDIGKTFRHEEYEDYKAGRAKTPEELKVQMPKSREMLEKMGIKHLELDGYEADDIIGTLSRMANEDPEWDALLVTSDHDYLQLITDVVNIKLLQQKGFTKYNPKTFEENLSELESIVKELENGNVDLDNAIKKYTEAMNIAKECSSKLDSAQNAVNEILKENGKLEEFNVEE